jgi:hypothetical protein
MANDERSRRSFALSTRTCVIQSPGVIPVVARNLRMNVRSLIAAQRAIALIVIGW